MIRNIILGAIFAMLTLAAIFVIRDNREPNAGFPIVQSAATKQPAWRLYAPCPVSRRNIPILDERIS